MHQLLRVTDDGSGMGFKIIQLAGWINSDDFEFLSVPFNLDTDPRFDHLVQYLEEMLSQAQSS